MARKSQQIVETARRLFLERGYNATSVDDIALEAGVSKTTVYNNFDDKETLFAAVVEGVTSGASRILKTLDEALATEADLAQRLERLATALLEGVLQPEVVQLRRLAISEALRFPNVAAQYWTTGPEQGFGQLNNAFALLDRDHELRVEDPHAAASHFAYLVIGEWQDRALLSPATLGTDQQRREHLVSAVSVFLSAYRFRDSDARTEIGTGVDGQPIHG